MNIDTAAKLAGREIVSFSRSTLEFVTRNSDAIRSKWTREMSFSSAIAERQPVLLCLFEAECNHSANVCDSEIDFSSRCKSFTTTSSNEDCSEAERTDMSASEALAARYSPCLLYTSPSPR